MAVVNLELPLLILVAGIVCALIAWLLATFTQFLRGYRYRVTLGLIAFPLGGLMGFVATHQRIMNSPRARRAPEVNRWRHLRYCWR